MIGGGWIIATLWTSNFILMVQRGKLCSTFCRRTACHFPPFDRPYREQQPVHIYTSEVRHIATKLLSHPSTMSTTKYISLSFVVVLLTFSFTQAQMKSTLTQAEASHFAALALKCINRELPNKPEHVINS